MPINSGFVKSTAARLNTSPTAACLLASGSARPDVGVVTGWRAPITGRKYILGILFVPFTYPSGI